MKKLMSLLMAGLLVASVANAENKNKPYNITLENTDGLKGIITQGERYLSYSGDYQTDTFYYGVDDEKKGGKVTLEADKPIVRFILDMKNRAKDQGNYSAIQYSSVGFGLKDRIPLEDGATYQVSRATCDNVPQAELDKCVRSLKNGSADFKKEACAIMGCNEWKCDNSGFTLSGSVCYLKK